MEVGAPFPRKGSVSGRIEGVGPGAVFQVCFPGGERASLAIRADRKGSELVVTAQGGDGAAAEGWSAVLTGAEYLIDEVRKRRRARQAVVVVHGIGSQRPMATLRRFTDALVSPGEMWSKPDRVSRSYELRRHQLRRTHHRPRTDIFELYWADKVPGTKLRHITAWLRSLMLRRPADISRRLRPVFYLSYGVLLTLVIAAVLLVIAVGVDGVSRLFSDVAGLAKIGWVGLLLSVGGAAVNAVIISTLGDAARYFDDAPDNIAVRQSIRDSGMSLLRRLHTEGRYDRIVIVGHSLGSVIGYDLICRYWLEVHRSHGRPLVVRQAARKEFTGWLGKPIATQGESDGYRKAQRDLWCEYRRLGQPWLITDLVTVGSPLTYADTLMARSPYELRTRIAQFELPVCPPRCAGDELTMDEKYLVDGHVRSIKVLTSGAPFAVVRWTNLYFPARWLVFGDPIGGPLASVLGCGIKDVSVTTSPWVRRRTPLAHTAYWRRPAGDEKAGATRALLEAIGLDSGRWLDEHVNRMPWEYSVAEETGP
ncbi:hypothetical protein H4696_000236 [Amycolatopsis lexingtonensis]|uniref:Uncharacterized protein n=1 Tax=Amycolatopsis lexingtonensis TaxID=218822 RepID=A0ABR9HQD7_9PSEU|nr:hypothetical protein [Amycolatopsis lexingtonensis]MBE1493136.1 hypothetical protein [Amycolatopsis lexingtonensis]